MTTPTPQPGESGSQSVQSTGDSSDASLHGTRQLRRNRLVHRDSAYAATENMTQDEHFKIISKIRRKNIQKQHAIECEYIHVVVNGCQPTV